MTVGLMGLASANATPFDNQSSTEQVHKSAKATRPARAHFYITSVQATGSHIPLVVTRYGNDIRANSSFVAYSQPQLNQTGQLNVGAELTQRDPALSSAFIGRH